MRPLPVRLPFGRVHCRIQCVRRHSAVRGRQRRGTRVPLGQRCTTTGYSATGCSVPSCWRVRRDERSTSSSTGQHCAAAAAAAAGCRTERKTFTPICLHALKPRRRLDRVIYYTHARPGDLSRRVRECVCLFAAIWSENERSTFKLPQQRVQWRKCFIIARNSVRIKLDLFKI